MKIYSKTIQTIIKFDKIFSLLLNELIVATKNILHEVFHSNEHKCMKNDNFLENLVSFER